ncbi:hypothetical protein O181_031588 [Austropuccinia psidii MF-1]|uniref:Reverse transcriptase Ty1/copia-type domain-containing protein n=1 Tax=Austropuccinia psidii MF-1 TaxID=1389203 RepID=A0A9Q3H4R5_9BASI|nr:hypothetical protein [Austropuccinia psidii MF-1]
MYNHHKHRDWKLAPPGSKGIFLGYENENSSYRILRLNDSKIIITCNAIFSEKIFPKLISGSNKARGEDNWCWLPNDSKEVQSYEEMNPRTDEISMNEEPIISESVDETHSGIVGTEPQNALKSEDRVLWQEAINRELNNINQRNVWEVIDMKEDYKLIGTTWIFRIKMNDQNEATDHKARLCTQGFSQTQGYDFNKTFAPTGRLNSLRTLIAFASKNNLEFHQIDIKSAFLNAELTETIYLAIPQGLNEDQRHKCLRLRKAIYGLKQAPLAWYT